MSFKSSSQRKAVMARLRGRSRKYVINYPKIFGISMPYRPIKIRPIKIPNIEIQKDILKAKIQILRKRRR